MKRHLLPILFIVTISVTLYANTLKNGFVYDDKYTIVDNILIKDISNLTALFDRNGYFGRSRETTYRPIVTFTYFIDYAVFGLKPLGYHLTNILLHTVNGVLLYIFFTHFISRQVPGGYQTISTRLTKNLPLLVSLLFITNPALTEAINAISFREDLLVFLFYMSALNLYLLSKSKFAEINHSSSLYLFYTASWLLLYALALLSKEMALTLPLVIYCFEYLYYKDSKRNPTVFNLPNLGCIIITIIYAYFYFYYFSSPKEVHSWRLIERLLTISWIALSYMKVVIFPVSLSVEHNIEPVRHFFSLSFIAPAGVMLLIMAYLIIYRNRLISFGIAFFLITLLPVYNIVPIMNPFAERYLYLPTSGFAFTVGLVICRIRWNLTSKIKILTLAIIVFSIVSMNVASSIRRNGTWKSDYLLKKDIIRKMPKSSNAHAAVGYFYQEKGQLTEAIQEYQIALKLYPYDSNTHNNLGLIYAEQGRLIEAVQHFKITIKLEPNNAEGYNNLGLAYVGMNKFSESIQYYKEAIALEPNNPLFHNNIGIAYYKVGWLDMAAQEFKVALSLKPDYPLAYNNLRNVYVK